MTALMSPTDLALIVVTVLGGGLLMWASIGLLLDDLREVRDDDV